MWPPQPGAVCWGNPSGYPGEQSWELHPAPVSEASPGAETGQLVSPVGLDRSRGALAAPRTRSLLTVPLGSAWSPSAFQEHHPSGALQGHDTLLVGHSRGTNAVLVGLLGREQPLWGSGADGSVPTAGCTFEEDSDPNQCEYSQGEDDDFDWELIRSYLMPHLTPDLPHGESRGPPVSLGTSVPTPLCVLYPRAGPCGSSWFHSCSVIGLASAWLCGKRGKTSCFWLFQMWGRACELEASP